MANNEKATLHINMPWACPLLSLIQCFSKLYEAEMPGMTKIIADLELFCLHTLFQNILPCIPIPFPINALIEFG